MGKGKQRNFPGEEKRKFFGILSENTGFYVTENQNPLFVENFRAGGGGGSISEGEFPPLPYGKNPAGVA